MPGTVIGFSDNLAHGPLDAEAGRVRSLRTPPEARADVGPDDAGLDTCAPFGEWRAVVERLERERPDAVIVWAGENVADAIFLAMACARLADRHEPSWRINVPAIQGPTYAAAHSPEQLARLYPTRERLSDSDRRRLARDFARIRDTCGLVRRLEAGRVVGVPVDHYDPLLLAACGPDWRTAARVVGTAMGLCDAPNMMGDVFFTDRLEALIEAGHIEASGLRAPLRARLVRRPLPA